MKDYHLHELDSGTFEVVVLGICSEILGIGVTGFSTGPDGGRDGKFCGQANGYPSSSSPWGGKWIIQSKHTENAIGTCSDAKFNYSFKTEEIPRIKALAKKGEVENYLLFTNRKKSAGAHEALEKLCKEALMHEHVGIIGLEDITRYLDSRPDLVSKYVPQTNRGPIRFSPQELAALIEAFCEDIGDTSALTKSTDFSYVSLETKNALNNVPEELAHSIVDDSEPYFSKIDDFLSRPQSNELRLRYQALASELKQKLITEDATKSGFATALSDIYDTVTSRHPNLTHNRRLITVFLHYMYASCDIGRKR